MDNLYLLDTETLVEMLAKHTEEYLKAKEDKERKQEIVKELQRLIELRKLNSTNTSPSLSHSKKD